MRFKCSERALAEALLPGETMLKRVGEFRLANLKKGLDWIDDGATVLYSEQAAKKALAALKVLPPAPASDRPATGQRSASKNVKDILLAITTPPLKVRARIVKVFATNPRFLHATGEKGAACITVRVRDNVNFLPGMEMDVTAGAGGVWDYVGPLPRARGRW